MPGLTDAMLDFIVRKQTVDDVLDEAVRRFAGYEALVHPSSGTRWTWRDLFRETQAVARGLLSIGVDRGEKIALLAPNCPEWVVFLFAAARIGAVLVPINTGCQPEELLYLLRQSRSRTLVFFESRYGRDLAAVVEAALPEAAGQQRGCLRLSAVPELRRMISLGDAPRSCAWTFAGLKEAGDASLYGSISSAPVLSSPDEVVNMQYTSGTTGFPKGVMLTHTGIVNNARSVGRNLGLTERDRVCLPVPLFHCVGCVLGALACACCGAAMVLMNGFSPAPVMAAVQQERCTALYGVPSFFLSVLRHRAFSRFSCGTLRTGVIAGAYCPEELMRDIIGRMGLRDITICYGLTEGSPVLTQTRPEDSLLSRVATVGRPLPGVEVSIRSVEEGMELEAGEEGEICCRGYNVMAGYHDMPEETAKAVDVEGWLHTGDLGRMDAEGCLVISGRIKDMIIRGGENVYPQEIEDFFRSMAGVRDIQVVAVPSVRYGEEVGAFIIPEDGTRITLEDMRAFSRGRLAWYKMPRHLMLVDDFPRTASGKIMKYRLREMAAAFGAAAST